MRKVTLALILSCLILSLEAQYIAVINDEEFSHCNLESIVQGGYNYDPLDYCLNNAINDMIGITEFYTGKPIADIHIYGNLFGIEWEVINFTVAG